MTEHPKRVQVLIDNGQESECICCGNKQELTFDHIKPLGKGGLDCNSNGQILCKDCNWHKGDNEINIKELQTFILNI
jgi:5-methylcytosine-specific restriction endonuclease McrA